MKPSIPIGYCCKCDEDVPLSIQTWRKAERKVDIVCCVFCETVLNLDGDYKVKSYITKKELDDLMVAKGYEFEEEQMNVWDEVGSLEACIAELEAQNTALKKTIEINSVGQEILEAKDKKIAELRIRIRW